MNARTGSWIVLLAAAWAVGGCLRVKEVPPVPPPVGLDLGRVVIVNDGNYQADVELTHNEMGCFHMADTLKPGQMMIRDIPVGKFVGLEQIPLRRGMMQVKRGNIKVEKGKSYEWRVGKRH